MPGEWIAQQPFDSPESGLNSPHIAKASCFFSTNIRIPVNRQAEPPPQHRVLWLELFSGELASVEQVLGAAKRRSTFGSAGRARVFGLYNIQAICIF